MRSKLHFVVMGTLPALLLIGRVCCKNINTFAGPYIVNLRMLEACPSDGTLEINVRPTHFNPSRPFDLQLLTGNVSVKEDIEDRFYANINVAVWANNQWKENFFIMTFPQCGCTAAREQAPDVFRIIADHSGAEMDKKKPCRIPPGFYVLKNEPVNLNFPYFKVMPYGRYMARIKTRYRNSNVTRFCLTFDFEMVQKPS
ncbi:uncharacterized protein LOC117644589 [Thrips palmi]|uniref:Uncharacterized protein LOC117644589 n=1 Tax=Thrips palmi TaxID=161013 RepID=A0A6P8Z0H2_THRPL|nr:uncharacterized protein LOC117644589 [Thrips palmi]